MTSPDLAPRSPVLGIGAVWLAALVISVAIGFFTPAADRAAWLCVGLAGCLILTFGIQVAYGRPVGFIRRVGLSMIGALLVMGLVSVVYALATAMTA